MKIFRSLMHSFSLGLGHLIPVLFLALLFFWAAPLSFPG